MKIPYNKVHIVGDVLFAARGGKIHSFSINDGSHISTWKHPETEKITQEIKLAVGNGAEASEEQGHVEGPPAKRQRTDADGTATAASEELAEESPVNRPEELTEEKRKAKKAKNRAHDQKGRNSRMPKVPDRPVITHLTSTADQKHLVAVSGHDKTIWLFENVSGHLQQRSQRMMPKRPSAISTSSQDSRIICADKFGDVYSLPLNPSQLPEGPSTKAATATNLPKLSKPQASTLTVHSKRNREALKNQLKQAELARKQGADPKEPEVPTFELELLLGHVSMLTSLVLGQLGERRCIITADRDEHVRVSRYIPQSHVIEGFCLGHKEFVNALVIPEGRAEILVSGGGDEDLFVWNWMSSSLLSRTSLIKSVRSVAPEADKVGVLQLDSLTFATGATSLNFVLAICEDVKAVFTWNFTGSNCLTHPSVIQLPGNPLSICVSPKTDINPPRIFAAVDQGDERAAKSIHVLAMKLDEGRLAVDTDSMVQDNVLTEEEPEVEAGDVRILLYGVETLRKQSANMAAAGEDNEEGGSENMPAEIAEDGT